MQGQDIGNENELYVLLSIYGGIIFAGLLLIVTTLSFAIVVRNKLQQKNIIREIYEKKERQNGQAKKGQEN